MINIKPGPAMKQYAAIYVQQLDFDIDEAIDEVTAWVSGYVNGPWVEALKPHLEATEQERLDSIKIYIQSQIDNSTTGRIRRSIECSKSTDVRIAAL